MLGQVSDPRMAREMGHPFQAILRLTLLGLICGQTTVAHIALFARMVSTPDVHAPASQDLRLPPNADHRPAIRSNSLTLQSP